MSIEVLGGVLDIGCSIIIVVLIFKTLRMYGGKFGQGLFLIGSGLIIMIFYSFFIHLFKGTISAQLATTMRVVFHTIFHILLIAGFYILWKVSKMMRG
jgi:hypothetical protein